jgi:ABC-type transport system substrate-binding protein
VVFDPVPDASARLLLLEAGEVALAGSITPDLLPLLRRDRRLAADIAESARSVGIALNTRVAPLSDLRVRQALNYAVDKEAIVRTVYQGQATALGGALSPEVLGSLQASPYAFEPERARRLLAEAGLANGFETSLLSSRGRFPGDLAVAQEVQRQLLLVGVRLRLEVQDGAQFNAAVTRAAGETSLRLLLTSWLPANGDARSALHPLFHSSQAMPRGFNSSFFGNQQLDELIDSATRATEGSERDRLCREAQELIREEAPWIFLVSPKTIVARSVRLHEPVITPLEVVTVSERSWLG